MEQYLDKMTAKIPDSIIISADVIISKAKENNEVFKFPIGLTCVYFEHVGLV